MDKPNHVDCELTLLDGGLTYYLSNKIHDYNANNFPLLLHCLFDIFELNHGSKCTYSIKVDDKAKTSLGDCRVNVLERIIALQNRIAKAKAVLH